MFCYRQSTGQFFMVHSEDDGPPEFKTEPIGDTGMIGELLGTGYSGRNVTVNGGSFRGRNEPQLESLSNIGPLPRGGYTIQPAENHPLLGVCAMSLIPDSDNQMFNRGDFWIHGDNATHDASHGCIVLDHVARIMISTQVLKGNCHLLVIA